MANLIIIPNNLIGYNFGGYDFVGHTRCYYRNDFRISLISKLILWNFYNIGNGNVSVNENLIYPINERVC